MKNRILFLADENIPKNLVAEMRKSGYDTKSLNEEKIFGLPDKEIIELAHKENRVILTLDKDFIYLSQYSLHNGIIVLRFSDLKPKNLIKKLLPLLKPKNLQRFKNSTTIITDSYMEIKKRPK